MRAWEAYYLARAIPGHEVPEWVTSYLDRVVRQMIDASRKEPTGAKLARAIAKALEMNGPRPDGRGWSPEHVGRPSGGPPAPPA